MRYTLVIMTTVCLIGCREKEAVTESSEHTHTIVYSADQHPDPQITIKESNSIYEEAIKITSNTWDGNQWTGYKFECSSASIDRVLKFLFMENDGTTPQIHGGDILPDCRFLIDFGERKWGNQEEARKDILLAIEEALGITIDYNKSLGFITVTKSSVLNHEDAEQVGSSNGG